MEIKDYREPAPRRGHEAESIREFSAADEAIHVAEVAAEPQEQPIPERGGARFLTGVSHLLSWVLSPVLMPTYAIITVFGLSMLSFAPMHSKLIIIAIVFGLTAVLPALAILVLMKYGDVHDAALTRRTDRFIPYVVTGCCLLGCGFYLSTTGVPRWVCLFYIGAALATVVNLLVNYRWKISAHGAGIGGYIAMIMIMNRYGLPHYNLWGWCVGAVLAAGLLGTARVWLGRHTPMQTVIGELVGFAGVLSMELLIPE
ncbi:MAG: hypothetical protein K2N19_05475 [Muribaculaceae bacterium]|nr:hypothetical protein [Muribaculaceae bacterium]